MNNITFLIFTYNEARRIEYVLRCFQGYGKIVVMDNHSTDNTREIAEKYGATVYLHSHPGWVEEESVANNALSKVVTTWVYWAYTDEILPKTLLEKLQEIANQDNYNLAMIHRKNLHYGIENINFDAGGRSPRFFKKGYVDFAENKIHGMGKFIGQPNEIINLPIQDDYSIYHCSTYNLSKFEQAHSRYSDLEAQIRFEKGERTTLTRLIIRPLYMFFRFYFLGKGYKNGLAGFIMIMQYCFFYFNVYAKLWEKENNITIESIEQEYDKIKEKLLK